MFMFLVSIRIDYLFGNCIFFDGFVFFRIKFQFLELGSAVLYFALIVVLCLHLLTSCFVSDLDQLLVVN